MPKKPIKVTDNFRQIADFAYDGILVACEPEKFLYANARMCEMTGYAPGELLEVGINGLVHPDHLKSVVEKFTRRLKGERPTEHYETVFIAKDWRKIPVELSAARIAWDSAPASFVIVKDISERKALEERQSMLASIIENTPDFIGIADTEGRIRYLNAAGRRLVGILLDADVTGMNISDFHPPWATDLIIKKGIPEAFKTGFWSGETVLLTVDKMEVPVWQIIISHRRLDGTIEFLSTTARDLSERKRAEEAQAMFRLMVESSLDPVLINDAETGRFIYVNPAAQKLFGYSQEEFFELRPSDLTDESQHADQARSHRELEREGVLKVRDRLLVRKDKTRAFADLNAVKVQFGGRDVIVGTLRDTTEQKRAEDDLKEKSSAIDAMNRVLHDLTIKLTVVEEAERKRLAEVLHERLGQNLVAIKLAIHNCLGVCSDAASRSAIEQVHMLLDESIETTRTLTRDVYPAPLKKMGLKGALDWYVENVLGARDVAVSLDVDSAVEDAPERLKQIIFSIIREAFQNISKHSGASVVEVVCRSVDGKVSLKVKDNGRGLDLQRRQDAGFGLALMREWARSENGVLSVRSAKGGGTEVRAEIPCRWPEDG